MKTKKKVILVQGPEESYEERLEKFEAQFERIEFEGVVSEEKTLKFEGIDDNYHRIKGFFDKSESYEFYSLGDAKQALNKVQISDFLKQTASEITEDRSLPIFIICAHGVAATVKDSGARPHFIQLDLSKEETDSTKKVIYTASIFSMINEFFKLPVEVIALSCQSSELIKAVHLLPLGSKLVTLSADQSNIRTGILNPFIELAETPGSDIEFSALTALEAYLLKMGHEDVAAPIKVSVSGRITCFFGEFYQNNRFKQIPLETLKQIYKEFMPFGYGSKVNRMLEEGEDIDTIYNEIAVRGEKIHEYKKLNTYEASPTLEQLQGLVSQMSHYSRIDEAVYALLSFQNMEKAYIEYRYGMCWGFYNNLGVKFNTSKPLMEALAVMFFQYSQEKGQAITTDCSEVIGLRDEIEAMKAKGMADQGLLDTLGDHICAGNDLI